MDILDRSNIEEYQWYRLDNAATVFSFVMSKRRTSLFRISVTLNERIKVSILQKALDRIIERFPYYQVYLRPGIFWYYWEQAENKPKISKEVRNPNQWLPLKQKGVFPFRVIAYNTRIAVEFSHIITDGTGALTFLKALVSDYLFLLGIVAEDYGDIPRPGQIPNEEEYEDAFKRYYKKAPYPKIPKKAFHPPYDILEKGIFHVITGIVSVKEILEVSRNHNVSLTEYLTAVYIHSLLGSYNDLPENERKKKNKPINIMVPINLRNMYPSKTMRNFSLFVTPGIDPRLGEYTFDEILMNVHHYLRVEINEKFINQQIARNVRGELNPILRSLPLFIKILGGLILYNGLGENLYSGVVTNLGRITMPEPLNDYIKRFEFVPAPSPATKTGCALVSYKDRLYINFGRIVKEADIERRFFQKLVEDGIKVKIETN